MGQAQVIQQGGETHLELLERRIKVTGGELLCANLDEQVGR